MSTHKRLTDSDYEAHTLFNNSKYLTPGLANILRDIDFLLYTTALTPQQYAETIIKF
jgi:hypothetical protein